MTVKQAFDSTEKLFLILIAGFTVVAMGQEILLLIEHRKVALQDRDLALGEQPRGAHDVAREFRILAALAPGTVPVPRVVALCRDPALIGAPFLCWLVLQARRKEI